MFCQSMRCLVVRVHLWSFFAWPHFHLCNKYTAEPVFGLLLSFSLNSVDDERNNGDEEEVYCGWYGGQLQSLDITFNVKGSGTR